MSSAASGPPWTTLAPNPGAIYHYSHPCATIESLPFELLFIIFSLVQADGWAGVALTAFQLVCRKWRALIVNNSKFWKAIDITLRDNAQLRRIKPSLDSRLRHRWPTTPLHISVTLFGLWEHDEQCECDRAGIDETGVCEWQADLVKNFYELLKILVGRKGRYMARWASFFIDIFQWNSSSSILWDDELFEFGTMFDHPAPLLEKVQLWSLQSYTKLFPQAPSLSAVRLRECVLDNPMNLTGIRRVWIDQWVIKPGGTCIEWDDLAEVEELTLRVGPENDMDDGDLLDDLAFTNLRKLRLLGYASKKILAAVGNCRLEQLILRVNSPDDLHSVVNSGIMLRDINEVVLGGFFKDSYPQDVGESAESLALAEARHTAFRALFHSHNSIQVTKVTLLGLSIGEELAAAGINLDGPRYWDESRNESELGAIQPWVEDEWDGNEASMYTKYGKPRNEEDESEDEDMDEDGDEDEGEDEDMEGSNL